jgi:hypothetical protein
VHYQTQKENVDLVTSHNSKERTCVCQREFQKEENKRQHLDDKKNPDMPLSVRSVRLSPPSSAHLPLILTYSQAVKTGNQCLPELTRTSIVDRTCDFSHREESRAAKRRTRKPRINRNFDDRFKSSRGVPTSQECEWFMSSFFHGAREAKYFLLSHSLCPHIYALSSCNIHSLQQPQQCHKGQSTPADGTIDKSQPHMIRLLLRFLFNWGAFFLVEIRSTARTTLDCLLQAFFFTNLQKPFHALFFIASLVL